MKKITLLLLLSLSALGIKAQNAYTLTTSQQAYSDLEDPISINNGEVWDWDTFSEVTIPFEFKISGQTVNRFLFDDDYFAFITPEGNYEENDEVTYVYPSVAYIQDRTFSTGTSTSPLSYKIEGTEGSRILKLEMKNVGNELATEIGFTEDHFYMNMQIWLYEADNVIEFRYGDHNITDISNISDEEDFIYLSAIENFNGPIVVLSGQSTNPTYDEFTEQNPPATIAADAFPANGTVYKLDPNEIAGINDLSTSAFRLYPNPASSVLNIQSNNLTASEYTIYNMIGKVVAQNKINDSENIQINVQNLEKGLYFVKLNDQYLKFIKE
jgi:hypothetical protein